MELGLLKPLYDMPGPFASAYLNTGRADPDAGYMIELRWRQLRGELERKGADARTLEAMDAVVGSDRGAVPPHGQAIIATGGSVVLQEELRVPNVVQRASFGQLPDLLPLLAQRAELPSLALVPEREHAHGSGSPAAAAQEEESARSAIRERFERGLADSGAVDGLVPTVEALRRGEVDTLLLRYGAKENDAWLWWGPQPGQLAAHPEELTDMRTDQIRRDRAADVLVRAAVQSSARLMVVAGGEPGPSGGAGALLRHA